MTTSKYFDSGEAVSEDLKVKQSCYDALQAAGLPDDSVLATNTSSISITKLAAKVSRRVLLLAVMDWI